MRYGQVYGGMAVQMAIKVNHRNRTICLVNAAQQRKGDGVVASHGDNPRQGLAGLGEAVFISIGVRLAHEDAVVAFFDLLDGPCVIVPGGISQRQGRGRRRHTMSQEHHRSQESSDR